MAYIDFIPVLFGSDINVYGMARAFHEEYGINSIAISKTIYTATVDSKIINFIIEKDLDNPDTFLQTLLNLKKQHKQKLLLVPCGDGYVELLVKFQDQLKDKFYFNCLSESLLTTLSLKESFYQICDKYGFEYPQTDVITYEDYKTKPVQIAFPIVIKASNSVDYLKCSFAGKRKVFISQDKAEYDRILNAIYSSSYKDNLTIQEFIPGDDTYMRVLNCYVGKDKKVKLMALGHPLLEEHTPQTIGNYVAIINTYDEKLLNKFKEFLELIGYQGFANFDMKLDMRDGKYELFETNVRQGRSSFYVTASGYNLAKWLVDDVIYNKNMTLTIAKKEHLWLQVPKGIVYKYLQNPELKAKAKGLIAAGKYTNSLFYSKDLSPSRYIKLKMNMLNHYKKYKKYFGKKGMEA